MHATRKTQGNCGEGEKQETQHNGHRLFPKQISSYFKTRLNETARISHNEQNKVIFSQPIKKGECWHFRTWKEVHFTEMQKWSKHLENRRQNGVYVVKDSVYRTIKKRQRPCR